MVDVLYHDLAEIGNIHIPHDVEYSTQALRKAGAGLETRHINRLVQQTNDKSYWRVDQISPSIVMTPFVPPAPDISDIGKLLNIVSDGTGYLKFGWLALSELQFDYLNIVNEGTVKAITDFLILTNTGNAADMDGTGTAIVFEQYNYDPVGVPVAIESGKIAVFTETDWTTNPNTHDSYMCLYTTLDGVVSEKVRITSDGKVELIDDIEYKGVAADFQILTRSSQNIRFLPNGDGIAIVGSNSTTHETVGNGCLLVSDILEVHGPVIIDDVATITEHGTAGVVSDVLSIVNDRNSTSMIGTGEALRFGQFYYDPTTPAEVDSGRISVVTKTNWTLTASTQDAYMSLKSIYHGVLYERLKLDYDLTFLVGTDKQALFKEQVYVPANGSPQIDAGFRFDSVTVPLYIKSAGKLYLNDGADNDVVLFYNPASTETPKLVLWGNPSGARYSVSINIDAPNQVLFDGVSKYKMDGTVINTGGRIVNTTVVNAATYNLLETDAVVHVTYTTTGAVTSLGLPTAQTVDGRIITIKDAGLNAGTNNITITTEGSETIDGSATYVISTNGGSVQLYAKSGNWYIV